MILVYKYIHEIHEKVLVSHEKVLETTLYKNNHQHVNLKYQKKKIIVIPLLNKGRSCTPLSISHTSIKQKQTRVTNG